MSAVDLLRLLRQTRTGFTDREFSPFPDEQVWLEDLEHSRALEYARHEREWSQRVWAAIMVSPRVEVCEALLRGVYVPAHRLDHEWMP